MGYWTIGGIPELRHLEPDERADLLRHVRSGRTMVMLTVQALLLAIFVGAPCAAVLTRWLPVPLWLPLLVVGGGVALAWYRFWLLRIRASLRITLMEATRGERLPVCLGCGYDLRDATGDQCPECGGRIVSPGHGESAIS